MNQFRTGLLAAAITMVATVGSAFAIPVTGQISIAGADTYTTTAVNFVAGSGSALLATQTGDFRVIGNTFNVTLNSFTYSPNLAPAPVTIFSVTNAAGTATATFSLATITSAIDDTNLNQLSINGTGTITLTGFDPTVGTVMFSTQGGNGGGTVTFSATSVAQAVPEPMSIALLGAGLVGAGVLRRRASQV